MPTDKGDQAPLSSHVLQLTELSIKTLLALSFSLVFGFSNLGHRLQQTAP